MYVHTTCQQEITVRNIVHEFAPLVSLEEGYIEHGDITDSDTQDTELWCEECSETVPRSDVEQEAEKPKETGLDQLKAKALDEEEHKDDCTDPTDPGTHCENCGACYSQSDVDGGRCLACGKMICGFEAGSPREAELRQALVDRLQKEYGGEQLPNEQKIVAVVICKFCHESTSALTAHLHDGGWVGDDCCWDPRLKATE